MGLKQRLWASVLAGCLLLLPGCSMTTNIDALLSPPKLSAEQAQINTALTKSVGKNIKLRYPKSGEYRSPFIVANIDGEPTDEAIVFYERTGANAAENSLRMKLLDQQDGKWVSMLDHSIMATDIDQVVISHFGDEEYPTVIAGYTLINQGEKILEIYSYGDSTMKMLYTSRFSDMEVMDLNEDGFNELILLTNSISNMSMAANAVNTESTAVNVATAKCLVREGDSFTVSGEVNMDTNSLSYTGTIQGYVGIKTPALFVDSTIGDGKMETQILYWEDDRLINPLETLREVLAKTIRPVGYQSTDIDNDGVVEIPVLSPFPGYETLERDAQFFATDWYVFEKNALTKKNTGYYNINDGYCFMLPSRWQGVVTAKEDAAADEVVFYKYDGQLSDNMTELMRISVMKRGTNADKLLNGYQRIVTKGQMEYMVKVADDPSKPLILTKSEIMHNFYVL